MPSTYSQNRADRLEMLDRKRIRCDGNSRSCLDVALVQFKLIRLDADGNPVSDEIEHKRACGRHLVQFDRGGQWRVVDRRPVDNPRLQHGSDG